MKICNYGECDRKHYAKGYCNGHYSQLREGRPLAPLRAVRGGPKVASSFRDEAGRKRCSTCREWLHEDAFGRNASLTDGLANSCRKCQRSNALWSKYRITGREFDAMLEAQGGVCAICAGVNAEGRALAVDHDHTCCSGERSCGRCVRSLLCYDCNVALGHFNDDPERIRRAANYLESHGS